MYTYIVPLMRVRERQRSSDRMSHTLAVTASIGNGIFFQVRALGKETVFITVFTAR
jgi:hypothetical protein